MKPIPADLITSAMNGSTLEIYIDGMIAAEVSDGRDDLDFVYEILYGMGYEVIDE